jgi:TolA-binding protein
MPSVEPLTPWSREAEDDAPLERRLSRLFVAVPEPGSLSEPARQRVAARLRQRPARGARLLLLRLVAVGVVLGVSGAAAAQWAALRWLGPRRELGTPPVPAVVVAAPVAARAPAAGTPVVVTAPPAEAVASARASLSPAAPAPAPSTRLGLEAASLEAALSALRGGGPDGAARALRAIEQHLREFPHGTLELEARVARVDALLLLGRRRDARRELSALPVENVGRKQELRLIRAELRAEDDCRGALDDFRVLVEQPLPAGWAERALFGRSVCLLQLGDRDGAERDFARYLERFPAGRFAEQIRAQRR